MNPFVQMSRMRGCVRRAAFGAALVLPMTHVSAALGQAVALPALQRTLPAGAVDAGMVPDSQPVSSITVELKRSAAQQADLESFLHDVQTAGSPQFHHWLTPAQFAKRFAPDASAVETWLQSQGFTLKAVGAGGMRVTASGTALQVEQTFSVELHRAVTPNAELVTVSGVPSAPAAIASQVLAVSGLDSTASASDPVAALASAVDANTSAVVTTDLSSASVSPQQLVDVLEQASAQGQTVIAERASALLPVRALTLTLAGDPAATDAGGTTPRPDWQNAVGLPADGLRHAPDAAVGADAAALAAALQSIVTRTGSRQGEVAETFYRLAPKPGIFSHADPAAAAGSWTATDGLGTVNVDALVKAWPNGVTAVNSSTIVLSAHTVTHGSNITLTATITPPSGGAMPTGTVTFGSAQGGTLSSANLDSGGIATYTTNALPGGQYGFFGTYNGDSTYASSTTNVDTATVNPEPAVVTAVAPSTAVGASMPVAVTVKSTSGVGQPVGAVTVYPYGSTIGTQTFSGTLAASGTAGTSTATVSVPATNAGTFTFQVNCTTDVSFSCYSPVGFQVTETKGTPAMSLVQTGSSSMTLTAQVSAPAGSTSAAVPTGSVHFLSGTTSIATVMLDSTGKAFYAGTVTSSGAISAQYSGDGNYTTASATPSSTPVKATPTVVLAQSATAASSGSTTLTATVTAPAGSSSAPTGSVAFSDGTTALGTQAVNASGVATYTGALATGMAHSLTAVYSGDTNFNTATSNTITNSSAKATPSLVLAESATSTAAAATLTATLTPPSGSTAVATGSVVFSDGSTALGTQTVNSSGVATYTGALASTSGHTLSAAYSGDTNYNAATSNVITQAAALIATSTSLTSSSGYSGPYGTTFNLSAVVTPVSYVSSGTAPTGTVTITDAATGMVVGTGTLSSGTAAIALSTLAVGPHQLTAMYGGDTNYASSSSNPAVVITITPVTATLAATISPTGSIPYGYNATLNATVTVPAGTPAGTITAVISGNNGTYTSQIATTTGSTSGTASVSFPVPPPGTYTITVTCSASLNCTAQRLTLTTTKGYTTTTVNGVTPSSPQAGVKVQISATVANSGTGTGQYSYSGTVAFYAGNKFLGTGTVAANGTATANVVFTSTNSLSVTAVYSGDTNWNGSTSQPITVTPTPLPATIVVTASSTSAVVGQNITLTATVSSGETDTVLVPSGTVTFYDTYNGIVVNLGTVALLSNGLNTAYAQLSTTGLQGGTHSITAVYTGDSIFLKTTSSAVAINVGDFSIKFLPSTLNILQGGTGTAVLTLSAVNSFTGSIALGCTPPPAELASCNVSPAVITSGGAATVTIVTTANSKSAALPASTPTSRRVAAAAGFAGLLSLLLLRRRRVASLFALLLIAAVVSGGCTQVASTDTSGIGTGSTGGGSANNGTPLGTVNFTITAASVDQPVNARHNFLLPVTVQ